MSDILLTYTGAVIVGAALTTTLIKIFFKGVSKYIVSRAAQGFRNAESKKTKVFWGLLSQLSGLAYLISFFVATYSGLVITTNLFGIENQLTSWL